MMTKPYAENYYFETHFGTPAAGNGKFVLRPGAPNLPAGNQSCDLYRIGAGFECRFGTHLGPMLINCDQMPIDLGLHLPCLAKVSHGNTSKRIHKWGWRGREAF